ncbi:hypothetical protein J1N35_030109 [Gossypium stocksii]|uniref:Retrovirus-related Pol polyprotein from transposon TNT 1-94 n=1 Tax=Gossypium stocksii TaxID=47602 RepID=A0A9D3ZTU7_9ROSI|nr:hypothetical protein J1N35_030109 [Gossypium stocksii]
MMAILVQSGLKKVVTRKKPKNLNKIEWEELDEKALSVIQLCLANAVLQENVEVHIDDEDQAMLLLCSLPPSYKCFRETLIYGRDKLLFEDVKGHLLSRDKLDNELHLDSKADRQASVLVASKKRDKRCKRTGSLYILEGSTVTGEIRRPSSVAESKLTRLERRQLGHRREKCMTVLLKRGFILDAGFEKLGHYIRDNQT